jgi:hypothetical protein
VDLVGYGEGYKFIGKNSGFGDVIRGIFEQLTDLHSLLANLTHLLRCYLELAAQIESLLSHQLWGCLQTHLETVFPFQLGLLPRLLLLGCQTYGYFLDSNEGTG